MITTFIILFIIDKCRNKNYIIKKVDVVKTRIMNAKKGTGEAYKNVFDCIYKTMVKEGPLAFYNGFTANANRIISFNIFFFVSLQQVRRIIYETSYKKE